MGGRSALRWSVPAGMVLGLTLSVPRLLTFGPPVTRLESRSPATARSPGAQLQGTRAATIDASPGKVWPWIAQIGHHGFGRAGWYAFDLADNDGVPSAWEIIPEAQRPQIGQVIGEEGRAQRITCPTLITEGEGDFATQSDRVHQALTCEKTLKKLSAEQGCGGHCCGLGQQVWQHVAYEWLTGTVDR